MKHPTALFPVFTLLLPILSVAADPPRADDLVVSMEFANATVTHYSATPRGGRPCHLEGGVGGRDESPSGIRPLSATIQQPGQIKGRTAILAAVPQRGGNSGIFGCFFALPDAYPGKLFYAGDRYGTGSNGKVKTDISSQCNQTVNKTLRSKILVYNCPGKKGGAGTPIARPTPRPRPEPAKEPEVAATPPEGGTCGYYGIFTCDRTLAEANKEKARLGSDLQVIDTTNVPGFGAGWYCVSTGPVERGIASAKVQQLKRKAPSSYVKKGC